MSILFRCDSNTAIGAGHVMRCLALAQGMRDEGWDVSFAMREGEWTKERIEQEDINVHVMMSGDAEETIQISKSSKADWIVVDGYQFDSSYQKALKDAGCKILFIDDYGHCDHYYADLVLNQNVYASGDLYPSRESYTKLLLGTTYVLLRREFLRSLSHGERGSKNILITLGGFGKKELSSRIQHLLDAKGYTVRVAVGEVDMPSLMQWADIAISAGGTTTYELARIGVPMILIITADNQQRVVDGAVQAGFAKSVGWHTNVKDENIVVTVRNLLADQEERLRLSRRGQELVDGKGVEHVLKTMHMSSRVCR